MLYKTSVARALVLHFAALAGWDGNKYLITFNRKTFDRLALKVGASPTNPAGCWGSTLVWKKDDPEPYPVTWINPAIKDMRFLARICAHEALHAARPLMRHGRPYEKAVTRMLRGQEP